MLKKTGSKLKKGLFTIEHDNLVNKIIKALSETGLGRFWQQPTGAAYRGDELIRYGLVGCADISGIIIGGKRIEIEVKTGKAVQSPQQKNFEAMIKMYGGFYFVCHSVDEAVNCIKSVATSS